MSVGHTLKALLVEDTDIIRYTQKVLLEQAGFAVDEAADGQSAIDQAKNNTYDLIVMDIGLPDMSGTEVKTNITDLSGYKDTPVVMLTAHRVTAEERESNEENVLIYEKPMTNQMCVEFKGIVNKLAVS